MRGKMEEFINQWLYDPVTGKIVTALIGIILIIVVVRLVQKSVSRYIKENTSRYRARKFVSFFGYLLVVLLLGAVFSDKLGGLTVALGVAGAGIAFALQEVITSIAGWFAITFANFYKTGDRVQMGGIRGDVIDIGVLRTTIMETGQWIDGDLYNGRVVRIANSFIFKEPVFNYSGEFPFLWDEIKLPVRFGSDIEETRQVLESIATAVVGDYSREAQKSWDHLVTSYLVENARVKPMVTLSADENWITFTIRYVVDFKKRRTTKDELFTRILNAAAESDSKFSIASASQEISVMKMP
jgi:small-conductance mechanosensitive channel